MDQPKIERMLRLMKLMSSTVNYTIEELSDKLDMSRRTIYRYIDTFKAAGFEVSKLYGNIFKLGKLPKDAPDFENLIYFSEEEAYMVNSLIDRLDPTNALKVNLKNKLATIYQRTSIADFVDKRSNAGNVATLSDAINGKLQVVLKNYESGNSRSVRDRRVEAFGFTTNYIDLWAYDLEDGRNKKFKVSRIEEVEILDSEWEHETEHHKQGEDIFRMTGPEAHRVKLLLSLPAKNILIEEYPLSERDIREAGNLAEGELKFLLDTTVYSYVGICRFYVGLSDVSRIIDSPELEDYVREYVKKNLV